MKDAEKIRIAVEAVKALTEPVLPKLVRMLHVHFDKINKRLDDLERRVAKLTTRLDGIDGLELEAKV